MSAKWPEVRLGEVLAQFKDYINEPEPREYPKLSVKLYGRGVTLDTPADGSILKMKRHQVGRAGQVILSEIWGKKGAIGFVPAEGHGALCTSHFFLFDVVPERLEPGWLRALFRSNYLVTQLDARAFGTTGYAAVRPKDLLSCVIPLPPLPDQRRMVTKIEQLAAKVQEAQTLAEQTGVEVEALFHQARAAQFECAAQQGTQPLYKAATLERGRFSHRPRNDPRFYGGSHPWIQIAEIERADKRIQDWHETLNEEGLAISKEFPRGTVLVSIAATIGAVGILDFDCCVPDSIVGVTARPGWEGEFLYHYLGYIRTHLERIAPLSAQKNINLKILSSLPVPNLAVAEQRRVAACLDDLKERMDRLSRLRAETAIELDSIVPAILDRAFKGEL